MTSPPFSLQICGAHELSELATRGVTHLISIWHPGADKARYTAGVNALFPDTEVKFIVFDDLEVRFLEEDLPPSEGHVNEVLEFAKQFDTESVVGIHCMAGISRSSAAAIAALTQATGPGSEQKAAERVRKIRPQSRPNRLIIQHADTLLGREGKLIDAVDEVFGKSAPEANKGW